MVTSTIVGLLLIISGISSNSTVKCYDFLTGCSGKTCFSSRIQNSQGPSYRFGCIGSDVPAYSHLKSCQDLLSKGHTKQIITIDDAELCCCNNADDCNKDCLAIQKGLELSSTEVLHICLGLLSSVCMFVLAWGLSSKPVASPVKMNDKKCCSPSYWNLYIIVFVLMSLVSSWFPSTRSCRQNEEQRILPHSQFIFQMMVDSLYAIACCTLPINQLLLELLILKRWLRNKSAASLRLSFFSVLGSCLQLGFLAGFIVQLGQQFGDSEECVIGAMTIAQISLFVGSMFITVVMTHVRWIQMMCCGGLVAADDSEEGIILDEAASSPLDTALSNTSVHEDDYLDIWPKPFPIRNREGVLNLANNHATQWIAIRVMISAPDNISLHPNKLILPPQRSATIAVCQKPGAKFTQKQGIMIQWFPCGVGCPSMNAGRLWQRPYLRPSSQWNTYVLPIYFLPDTVTEHSHEEL